MPFGDSMYSSLNGSHDAAHPPHFLVHRHVERDPARLLRRTYPAAAAGDARLRVGEIDVAGHPYRVAIAASLEEVIHEGLMLRRAVLVAVPLALLLAALGGAIAATRALRPVRRMVDEASTITATDP